MSDRTAVPLQDRDKQWKQDLVDRVAALEKRQVNGSIALEQLNAADATLAATRTTPVKLAGSKLWTQDVEYLGATPPGAYGVTGGDALVTRDEVGYVQAIAPAPFAQYDGNQLTAIASTTVVPITYAGASRFSAPYSQADTFGAPGQLIVPITGTYDVYAQGAWPNVLGVKGRVVIIQYSPDGGASWPTLFADGRSGINTASLGQDVSLMGRCPLPKGYRVRVAVIQDEAGSLNYVAYRFSLLYVAGRSF